MYNWKSSFGLLSTSLIIVYGKDILKKFAFKTVEHFPVQVEISKILCTMFIIPLSVWVYLRTKKPNNCKTCNFYEFLIHSKEHLGISIAISATAFVVRSFYSSLDNFDGSLTSLYTAFLLVITSIILFYGKTRIPSGATVIFASRISLVFALLGLVIMMTTNRLTSAFVVCFAAAFSLVISAVLFLMNILRTEAITNGINLNYEEQCKISSDYQQFNETAEEAFENDDKQRYNVSTTDKSMKSEESMEKVPILAEEKHFNFQDDAIADAILSDLAQHAKSLNKCVKALLSKDLKERIDTCEDVVKSGDQTNEETDVVANVNDLTDQTKSVNSCVHFLLSNVEVSPKLTL